MPSGQDETSGLRAQVEELTGRLDALGAALLDMAAQTTAQHAINQMVFADLFESGAVSPEAVAESIEGMIATLQGAEGSAEIISALEAQLLNYRDPEGSVKEFFKSTFGDAKQ